MFRSRFRNCYTTPKNTPAKTTFRDWCLYSSLVHGVSNFLSLAWIQQRRYLLDSGQKVCLSLIFPRIITYRIQDDVLVNQCVKFLYSLRKLRFAWNSCRKRLVPNCTTRGAVCAWKILRLFCRISKVRGCFLQHVWKKLGICRKRTFSLAYGDFVMVGKCYVFSS